MSMYSSLGDFSFNFFFKKVTWHGKSGESYTFKVYRDKIKFFSEQGIYIFCKESFIGGEYYPLYVGQTHSFKERLYDNITSHEYYDKAIKLGMTHIAVMETSKFSLSFISSEEEKKKDKENRLNIEEDLILGLKPALNP